jgi:hypothetical protein
MTNARVRLSQPTIDSLVNLGQQCGIDDPDTLIKLLIRKYGDQLTALLAPSDPIRDNVTQNGLTPPTNQVNLSQPDPIHPITVAVLPKSNSKPPRPPIEGF